MKKIIIFFLIIFSFFQPSFSSIVEELTELNNLYKEGAISKDEFSKAKSIILKTNSSKPKAENELNIEKEKVKKIKEKKIDSDEIKNNNTGVDLSKTYVSFEEFNELGTYQKIKNYPDGLFKIRKSPEETAKESMMQMYYTFVQKPKLLEKYPENMMKAMAHFEIFYNYQLKENEKSVEKFKKNYPNINWKTKKDIKTLYSLNNAKKSMREALSLNEENTLNEALDRYMLMHNFLKPAVKITNKLSSTEKKLKNENSKLKKYYGNLKKTITEKSENRINDKDFKKDLDKSMKKLKKSFKKITNINSETDKLYSSIENIFNKSMSYIELCKSNCTSKELNLVIDATNVNLSILKEFEPKIIKKRYTQNMDDLNLDDLAENDQASLALITSKLKRKKKIDAKETQKALLNIQANGFDLDIDLKELDENGFEVKSIFMSFDSVDNMKRWAMKDWANSWRGELPDEIKDNAGNVIEFTDQNVEDIKAQLAYNSFKSLIDSPELKEAISENISENIQEIAKEIRESDAFDVDQWLSQDFSISLDNYSQLVGNSLGIELNNFEDLTQTVNDLYGTDVTADEYAAAWETAQYLDGSSTWGDVTRGVDLIDQLGSFDAASIAKDLGADLSTVADSIVAAANVGVSTDLEQAAQGLGYSSFAEAVDAYNKQYGTNYTEESAKEALGQ